MSETAKPFDEATITSISGAAEGLALVRLDVGEALARSYATPGQYTKAQVEGVGESFFAIASAPGSATWDLLLKRGSPLVDAIASKNPGDRLAVATAMGKGFPIERAAGRDLVLVATGSGISPIRAVIEHVRAHRSSFGAVSLHFGARTPQSFAFAGDFDGWRAAGISVRLVVSRPEEANWSGLTGYVQSHLGGLDLPNAVVFLCGQKAMVAAAKEILSKQGISADHMFLNF